MTFFILFVCTIVFVRLWLWFLPKHGPKIFGIQVHHYAYGLLIILISFFILKPLLLPIGAALFVDEIPLFFMFKGFNWPHDHWKQYHSWQSIISIAVITLLGYVIIHFLIH